MTEPIPEDATSRVLFKAHELENLSPWVTSLAGSLGLEAGIVCSTGSPPPPKRQGCRSRAELWESGNRRVSPSESGWIVMILAR